MTAVGSAFLLFLLSLGFFAWSRKTSGKECVECGFSVTSSDIYCSTCGRIPWRACPGDPDGSPCGGAIYAGDSHCRQCGRSVRNLAKELCDALELVFKAIFFALFVLIVSLVVMMTAFVWLDKMSRAGTVPPRDAGADVFNSTGLTESIAAAQ